MHDHEAVPTTPEELVDTCVRAIITAGGSRDGDLIDTVTTWADLTATPTLALIGIAASALHGYAAAVQGMFDNETAALDYLNRLAVINDAERALQAGHDE